MVVLVHHYTSNLTILKPTSKLIAYPVNIWAHFWYCSETSCESDTVTKKWLNQSPSNYVSAFQWYLEVIWDINLLDT